MPIWSQRWVTVPLHHACSALLLTQYLSNTRLETCPVGKYTISTMRPLYLYIYIRILHSLARDTFSICIILLTVDMQHTKTAYSTASQLQASSKPLNIRLIANLLIKPRTRLQLACSKPYWKSNHSNTPRNND